MLNNESFNTNTTRDCIHLTMPYDPQKHHRRSIRLKGHNYTQPGAYYITLCTKARQCLFGDVVKGEMQLNSLGHIAFTRWQAIPDHFPHVELDAFVVMPNHLHGILVISDTDERARQCRAPTIKQNHSPKIEQFGKPVSGSIPTVIRSYKGAVTKRINLICNTKYTSLIWQRDLYEHISRDEESLHNIRQYIVENPWRWADDPENPQHHPKNHELLLDLPF
jgi:REP element-mobilizing transposase RayT